MRAPVTPAAKVPGRAGGDVVLNRDAPCIRVTAVPPGSFVVVSATLHPVFAGRKHFDK